jgi:hypothetical protein
MLNAKMHLIQFVSMMMMPQMTLIKINSTQANMMIQELQQNLE